MTAPRLHLVASDPAAERVRQLSQALKREGFEIAGTGPLDAAPDVAAVSVIVWDEHSLGVAAMILADLPHPERAISVLLERNIPPAAASSMPVIDLSAWRGSAQNLSFRDLLATIRAMIAHVPPPSRNTALRRMVRRSIAGGAAFALLSGLFAFLANVASFQENICSVSTLQPEISDFCGMLSFGGKPSREERLAWAALPQGDCTAIAAHARRFPDGAYRAKAAELINTAKVTRDEVWTPDVKRLPMFAPQDGASAADLSAAKAQALERAQATADKLCLGFAATAIYRATDATPEPKDWSCSEYASGTVCGFDGTVACGLEVRTIVETRWCGKEAE